MKKKLTNNLSLKIVSVLVAVVIWLAISSANDPVQTKAYTVKINVTNAEYIYDAGKTYRIDDEDQQVTVYVTAKQSILNRNTDLTATADLTQIVNMESDPAYVPIQIASIPGVSMENVSVFPKTVPVSIEDVKTKEYVITVTSQGDPESGYVVGECIPSQEKVTIRGPESIIDKIKNVVAYVDVTAMSHNYQKETALTIFDLNGDALSEESMSYLEYLDLETERTIDVDVELWEVADDVSLKANYSGSPAFGYQVDKVTMNPETISVAGSEEALKALEDNNWTVEIPGELVNVDGVSEDLEVSVKLSSILKEEDGYKIPDSATQSVIVKIAILPYGSKEFEVGTDDVTTYGLPDKLRLTYNQDQITVRVKGSDADMEVLQASDIKLSIDLTDKEAGEYVIPVTVVLPDGYEQVDSVFVTIQLIKTERDSSE